MIVPQRYICEAKGCGAVHSESNRWWVVSTRLGCLSLYRWETAEEVGLLNDEHSHHFCGQNHALQFVSSEMGDGKIQITDERG